MTLESIDYADGGTALTGWVARPASAPRAAVVIFPTIVNVNPAMERRAQMLADAGYLAMIADFYGQPVADFAASRPLAEALRADVEHYRQRLHAAVTALRGIAGRLPLAAIGFCMGGQAALELAREGANLALVASFHGLLHTDRKADKPFAGRILVLHGDADPMAPRDHVIAFWDEMDAVGNNWHFHSYSGVRHGFTDPASDVRGMEAIRYDASADRQSWAALTSLLNEIVG